MLNYQLLFCSNLFSFVTDNLIFFFHTFVASQTTKFLIKHQYLLPILINLLTTLLY